MTFVIYLTIIFLGLALWIKSLAIVNKRKELIRYLVLNSAIFIAYSYFWYRHSKLLTGHDEYGLGALFGYPLILAIHSIIFFVIIMLKQRKRNYR